MAFMKLVLISFLCCWLCKQLSACALIICNQWNIEQGFHKSWMETMLNIIQLNMSASSTTFAFTICFILSKNLTRKSRSLESLFVSWYSFPCSSPWQQKKMGNPVCIYQTVNPDWEEISLIFLALPLEVDGSACVCDVITQNQSIRPSFL